MSKLMIAAWWFFYFTAAGGHVAGPFASKDACELIRGAFRAATTAQAGSPATTMACLVDVMPGR